MTKPLEALIADMKAAAEKATPLQLDTAQIVRGNSGYLECPCCEGAGYVEEENDFCNIDGEPLGVQFYGIGSSFGLAEEYFRQVSPANVKALIAALEQKDNYIAELREWNSGLAQESCGQQKRIAELEASQLAVKLPKKFNIPPYFTEGEKREALGVNRGIDECAVVMRSAGITVQGGE